MKINNFLLIDFFISSSSLNYFKSQINFFLSIFSLTSVKSPDPEPTIKEDRIRIPDPLSLLNNMCKGSRKKGSVLFSEQFTEAFSPPPPLA